jgi:hypothetical protein
VAACESLGGHPCYLFSVCSMATYTIVCALALFVLMQCVC